MSPTLFTALHLNRSGERKSDTDSNGFPKRRRNVAVDLLRKAGALLLSGDAHLRSFAPVGVKDVNDGVHQFTIPALGSVFWRWFYPATPGADRIVGNPFPVFAVADPEARHLLKETLTQLDTVECWRHDADPSCGDRLFQRWPITIPGRKE